MTESSLLQSVQGSAEPSPHLVQLYGADPRALVRNVVRFLEAGLGNGETLLVIATPEHRRAFETELNRAASQGGAESWKATSVFLDAEATLDAMLIDGQPDWCRFEQRIGGVVREMRERPNVTGIRAYGEMVGLLWDRREQSAAARLEHFWNRLLEFEKVPLFCAYPIDVFGRDFQIETVDAVLCAHSHMVPSGGEEQDLEAAIDRAMNDVFGPRAERLRPLITANYRPSWGSIPRGEAVALWLRNNLPDYADEVLARARGYVGRCA